MGERMPARFCVPSALTERRCSAHRDVPRKTGGWWQRTAKIRGRTRKAHPERSRNAGGAPGRACATAVSGMPVGQGQLRRDSPVRRVRELRSNTASATRSAAAERFVHNPRSIAYFEYIEVCCVAMLARTCGGGGNAFPILGTRMKPCNGADPHDACRCASVSTVVASEIRNAVYSRYTSRLSFGVIVSGSRLRWRHIASTGRARRQPTVQATRECAVGRHRGPRSPGRRLAHTSNLSGRSRCRYELAAHHAVADIHTGVRHD